MASVGGDVAEVDWDDFGVGAPDCVPFHITLSTAKLCVKSQDLPQTGILVMTGTIPTSGHWE
jgi:hypothetical protein